MTAYNDITGDAIKTGGASSAYRDGWDRIFGKKEQPEQPEQSTEKEDTRDDANNSGTCTDGAAEPT